MDLSSFLSSLLGTDANAVGGITPINDLGLLGSIGLGLQGPQGTIQYANAYNTAARQKNAQDYLDSAQQQGITDPLSLFQGLSTVDPSYLQGYGQQSLGQQKVANDAAQLKAENNYRNQQLELEKQKIGMDSIFNRAKLAQELMKLNPQAEAYQRELGSEQAKGTANAQTNIQGALGFLDKLQLFDDPINKLGTAGGSIEGQPDGFFRTLAKLTAGTEPDNAEARRQNLEAITDLAAMDIAKMNFKGQGAISDAERALAKRPLPSAQDENVEVSKKKLNDQKEIAKQTIVRNIQYLNDPSSISLLQDLVRRGVIDPKDIPGSQQFLGNLGTSAPPQTGRRLIPFPTK